MVRLIWVIGFLYNGAPQIDRVSDPAGQMTLDDCEALIEQNAARMADWWRGVLRAPLTVPVGVRGECVPVLRTAHRP
jgi:hypothetical protein